MILVKSGYHELCALVFIVANSYTSLKTVKRSRRVPVLWLRKPQMNETKLKTQNIQQLKQFKIYKQNQNKLKVKQ